MTALSLAVPQTLRYIPGRHARLRRHAFQRRHARLGRHARVTFQGRHARLGRHAFRGCFSLRFRLIEAIIRPVLTMSIASAIPLSPENEVALHNLILANTPANVQSTLCCYGNGSWTVYFADGVQWSGSLSFTLDKFVTATYDQNGGHSATMKPWTHANEDVQKFMSSIVSLSA